MRSTTLAPTGAWESYPQNPLFPPMGTPCAPAYASWAEEDGHLYLMLQGEDENNDQREYFYELVINDNVGTGIMYGDDVLLSDETKASSSGQFVLHYQSNGDLALMRDGDSTAIWRTHSENSSTGMVRMQGDGHFLVANASNGLVWSSGTNDHPGAYLVVQNDGNMVIYDSGGAALWCTSTGTLGGEILFQEHQLNENESVNSVDQQYTLVYQGDGNLVYYHNGVDIPWATNTSSSPGHARLEDGNLVVRNGNGGVVWSSGTGGHANAYLQVQSGVIQIWSSGAFPHTKLWERPTMPLSFAVRSDSSRSTSVAIPQRESCGRELRCLGLISPLSRKP